jgi:copper chaperone CopZ
VFRTLVVVLLIGSTSALADATTVHIGIRGMVCGFCASGLKKKFSSTPGVVKVDVSLEKKEVVLQLEPTANLTDLTIIEKVKDAGYDVTGISR